jgi:phage gpG-like protein
MKVKINLNSPMFNRSERRAILDDVVQQSAAELETEIKNKILAGPKTGRLYRKGPITRASSKKLLAAGFKPKRGNAKRVIVGANIHRASAPGQSPASDTGGLVNSVRAKKTGDLKSTVSSSKDYAAPLDDGAKGTGRSRKGAIAPRPFFKSTAKQYEPTFRKNVEAAVDKLK